MGSGFKEYLKAFAEAQDKFTNDSSSWIGKCIKYGEIHRSGKAINSRKKISYSAYSLFKKWEQQASVEEVQLVEHSTLSRKPVMEE